MPKPKFAGITIRMGAGHNEVTLPGGVQHALGIMKDDDAKFDRAMVIKDVCKRAGIRSPKRSAPQ